MQFTNRADVNDLQAHSCAVCDFLLAADDAAYFDRHEDGAEVYHADCFEFGIHKTAAAYRQCAAKAKFWCAYFIADRFTVDAERELERIDPSRRHSGADIDKALGLNEVRS